MPSLISLVVAVALIMIITLSVAVALFALTIVRRGHYRAIESTLLQPSVIRQHLDLLPNNAHLIDWYQSRDVTIESRRLNRHLPELVAGPLWVPLRPHETLLYADDLGRMVQKEIMAPSQTIPPRSLAG